MTYDPNWLGLWIQRFGDPLLDAETFRLTPEHTLAEIGNKPKSVEEVQGQYMGLLQGVSRDKLEDNYSHFVMAGGPIGAVHPKFEAWHKTYWDNLDVTVSLHKIKRVVGLSHRDCGAAKLAFGEAAVAKRESETEAHAEALAAFRDSVKKRHPKLSIITGVMDTNGKVDLIG